MALSQPPSRAQFRHAEAADLPVLLPLVREFYRHFGYPYDEPHKREALERLLQNPSLGRVWLLAAGDRARPPIGYLVLVFSFSLESNGTTASIDEFFIEPASRQRGVGTAVLRRVEDACRELGVTAVHLEAEDGNAQATALYLREGFVDHGRRLLKKRLSPEGPREA
jgi:GNAT superfamily N-acetyltransferase